jgi:hypothetical protein
VNNAVGHNDEEGEDWIGTAFTIVGTPECVCYCETCSNALVNDDKTPPMTFGSDEELESYLEDATGFSNDTSLVYSTIGEELDEDVDEIVHDLEGVDMNQFIASVIEEVRAGRMEIVRGSDPDGPVLVREVNADMEGDGRIIMSIQQRDQDGENLGPGEGWFNLLRDRPVADNEVPPVHDDIPSLISNSDTSSEDGAVEDVVIPNVAVEDVSSDENSDSHAEINSDDEIQESSAININVSTADATPVIQGVVVGEVQESPIDIPDLELRYLMREDYFAECRESLTTPECRCHREVNMWVDQFLFRTGRLDVNPFYIEEAHLASVNRRRNQAATSIVNGLSYIKRRNHGGNERAFVGDNVIEFIERMYEEGRSRNDNQKRLAAPCRCRILGLRVV